MMRLLKRSGIYLLIVTIFVVKSNGSEDKKSSEESCLGIKNPLSTVLREYMPRSPGALLPGEVHFFTGKMPPAEPWLLCNGTAVSRRRYQRLFLAIGEKFGRGDGNTTFNLPNFNSKNMIADGALKNATAVYIIYSGLPLSDDAGDWQANDLKDLRKIRGQIDSIINDAEIKYAELTGYSICDGRIQLKNNYRGKSINAPNKLECLRLCALKENSEVAELTGEGQCICSSNVKARFFAFVPRRYLACSSSPLGSDIMYRRDRLHANLTAIGSAYLFFALDEISGVQNVANMQDTLTDATWKTGDRGRYDCAPLTSGGPRALQLFNADHHFLATTANLHYSNRPGFTMMAWAKRRDGLTSGEILTTSVRRGSVIFYSKRTPNAYIYQNNGDNSPADANTITIGAWNHVAMVHHPNYNVWGVGNGKIVFTKQTSDVEHQQLFIGNFHDGNYAWDGCLSHVALFRRALTTDEIKVVSALFQDNTF